MAVLSDDNAVIALSKKYRKSEGGVAAALMSAGFSAAPAV